MAGKQSTIKIVRSAKETLKLTDYDDPSNFLSSLYELSKSELKKDKVTYSYRKFASDLGLGETNYLHLVCNQKRRLTKKTAAKICEHLQMKGISKDYFFCMVDYSSPVSRVREKALSQIYLLKQKHLDQSSVDADKIKMYQDFMEYLGTWYLPVLRELVGLPDFEEDPFWLAGKITPKVRAKDLASGLKLLERLGFLQRQNGRLVQNERNIQAPSHITAIGVKKYHKNMLDLSRNALQTHSAKNIDFQAVTFNVNEPNLKEFKIELHKLISKFIDVSGKQDGNQEVYQLNTQLFPLTRPYDNSI